MTQRCLIVLLACLSLLPVQAPALVDPAQSTLPTQRWLAQIYVDDGGTLKEFCKGALIHAQWVLTTGYCLYDPFETLGAQRDESGVDFVVRLAASADLYEVVDFVQSSDLAIGMMKLKRPATVTPAVLTRKTEAELRNSNVYILGNERTEAIGDSYFNQMFGNRMYCRIDGALYYTPGAICYILGRQVKSATQLETRAVIIDPATPGSPSAPIDRLIPFDTSGKKLYLDFRADASYPCHEDLGAPIVRNNAGAIEIVGVVAGVGMALGMPACNPSLSNTFSAVAYHQDFINKTLTQSAFDAQCPAQPEPSVAYTGERQITLSWDPVPGAHGYRLFYTSAVGYVPFRNMNVGTRTELTTEINPEVIYRVAVVAYNDVCTSEISDELAVAL